MFDVTVQHQKDEFEIISNIAMEYMPQAHTHYLSTSDPQDFLFDLREFYLTWYTDFGEIRLGKQIHTWGSADENSPIDMVNAYDYYYLFFNGTDRKLGSYSASVDLYLNDWKFGVVLSPYHHTNRIPINDPEFPIKLPITPFEYQIYPIEKNPFEFGGFMEYSHNYGDIRMSYFNGYDRIFNLSGINAFYPTSGGSVAYVDIVYGYRKTNMFGLGNTLLIGDLILRGDLAYFRTKDQNQSIERENPDDDFATAYPSLELSYPLKESADYYQSIIQFEYGLPWEITIIGQFFSYDTLNYESDGEFPIIESVNIPGLDISAVDSRSFFSPGMGAPNAALTKQSITFNLEKSFLENQLKISFISMMDVFDPTTKSSFKIWGKILGINVEYDLYQDLKIIAGLTQISGDDFHPAGEQYRFNQMEDFSHLRFDLNYSF